jgi:hypothetical protein
MCYLFILIYLTMSGSLNNPYSSYDPIQDDSKL